MIEIDVSQAPRGVLAAQRLIHAVAEQGDMAERHFLELKSTLDLSQKRDIVKIAKFILGAANRMPDIAATAFEGYGVMIIGVAEKTISGIQPVEMMDLAKIVQRYVGAAGPRWDVVWVPIEGITNQVLVVLVDPPQFGQGPFPCRASGESLVDGRIYIRAEGETREANSEELDLLIRRGMVSAPIEVDFGVDVVGEVVPVMIDDASTVDEYVTRVRQGLVAALPAKTEEVPAEPPLHTSLDSFYKLPSSLSDLSILGQAMMEPEERTEEEYLQSIHDWEESFRSAWTAAQQRIIGSHLRPSVVRIVNRTTTFFHDVEVRLHLAGDIYGLDYREPESLESFEDLELPRPPRKWGPTQRSFSLPSHYLSASHLSGFNAGHYFPSSISYTNGGSVTLDLTVGELRPRGSYESEDKELVLVIADHSLTTVHGTWELTARDHNEVYTGNIEIQVGPPRDLTAEARRVLGLDRARTGDA